METVKRILQDKISNRIAPGKAVLIFGARRVGKTVMMRQIVDGYPGRTMMLNGEDYDTLALLENRTMANYLACTGRYRLARYRRGAEHSSNRQYFETDRR